MIKIKIGNKTYKKLSVFDFDGTLFKSPDKPDGYKGNWWISKVSLNEPTIPRKPDDSYWNMEVVRAAISEAKNPNNLVVLMTGRIGDFFHERIIELIKQKKLNFKHVWCNEFGRDAGEFKVEKIKSLLNKHPSIKQIEMWDDDPEKIELYTNEFSSSYAFKINKIPVLQTISRKNRKNLKEMYYYEPDYPDTNTTSMSKHKIDIKAFDFFFEKSDQKQKAFDPKTKFFVIPKDNKLLIFKKGDNEPFVDFEGKFDNLENAKKEVSDLKVDNYLIAEPKIETTKIENKINL